MPLAAPSGIVAAIPAAWRHTGGIAVALAAIGVAAWRHYGGNSGGTAALWRHDLAALAAWRHSGGMAALAALWRHYPKP